MQIFDQMSLWYRYSYQQPVDYVNNEIIKLTYNLIHCLQVPTQEIPYLQLFFFPPGKELPNS